MLQEQVMESDSRAALIRSVFGDLGLEEPEDLIEKESDARRRILRAALHLFATNGYEGTAVDRIISDSETSPSTLYRQFESKEGLMNALYSFVRSEMSRYYAIGIDDIWASVSYFEVLRRGLAFSIFRPYHHEILFVRDFDGILNQENRDRKSRLELGGQEVLRRGQALMQIREGDIAVIDSTIRGTLNLVLQRFNQGTIELTKENVELVIRMIWDAIRY